VHNVSNPLPQITFSNRSLLWDTLTVASLWNNFVSFVPFNNLEITTSTNGDPTTVTGQLSRAEVFRRDIGNLFSPQSSQEGI
jgi:hypothetical protein